MEWCRRGRCQVDQLLLPQAPQCRSLQAATTEAHHHLLSTLALGLPFLCPRHSQHRPLPSPNHTLPQCWRLRQLRRLQSMPSQGKVQCSRSSRRGRQLTLILDRQLRFHRRSTHVHLTRATVHGLLVGQRINIQPAQRPRELPPRCMPTSATGIPQRPSRRAVSRLARDRLRLLLVVSPRLPSQAPSFPLVRAPPEVLNRLTHARCRKRLVQ